MISKSGKHYGTLHIVNEWKRRMNVHDDEYLQAKVSIDSYYKIMGNPDAWLIDPTREYLFYMATTGVCVALLWWLEIGFELL